VLRFTILSQPVGSGIPLRDWSPSDFIAVSSVAGLFIADCGDDLVGG
jgi:hypothetical protein